MEPNDLAANMVAWYGHHVSTHVFAEYLNTYIELNKPDLIPMFLYKALCSSTRRAEFIQAMNGCSVVVTGI